MKIEYNGNLNTISDQKTHWLGVRLNKSNNAFIYIMPNFIKQDKPKEIQSFFEAYHPPIIQVLTNL